MGRPCRCCRGKKMPPDSVIGRCPCTPWEISVERIQLPTALDYDRKGVKCHQAWWCADDGKEGGNQDLVDSCAEFWGTNRRTYWAPEICEPVGELQEYAGYVKLPPSPQCLQNSDDPSSTNTPKCGNANLVISKIIHIGTKATVAINLHADSQAGECQAQARNESISYEAEPGWYEIAYSYSEIVKSKQVWGTSGGQTMYDANGEISAHSSGVEGWQEVFDDYATPVHAAYIRKFIAADPNKVFAMSFGADPEAYSKEVLFSNPADKLPAAQRLICCNQFQCQSLEGQETAALYGASPLVQWGLTGDVVPWDVPNIYMKYGTDVKSKDLSNHEHDVFRYFDTDGSIVSPDKYGSSTCARVETFSAIAHFEGAQSAEARIAAFEFTFTPSGDHEPDIWPEGSEAHKRALKIITEDVVRTENCQTYEEMLAVLDNVWGDPTEPDVYQRLEKLKEGGCLCYGEIYDANGTISGVHCSYLGCQDLTPKDIRTVWTYNESEARKAMCPEPSNEVIDCGDQFVETDVDSGRPGLDDEGITTHGFDATWRMTGDAYRQWLSGVKPPRYDPYGRKGLSHYEWEKDQCQQLGYDDVHRGQPPCGRGAWKLCYEEGCF